VAFFTRRVSGIVRTVAVICPAPPARPTYFVIDARFFLACLLISVPALVSAQLAKGFARGFAQNTSYFRCF
jgi:hypothetical protein